MGEHVCFLVAEHPFLDARIFKKEAKSLVKLGYYVTMIVPRRNGYLHDTDGRAFDDMFLHQTFHYEGVKIITYEQINLDKHIKELYHHVHSGNAAHFKHPLTQLGINEEADIYHAHEFMSLYAGIGVKRTLAASGNHTKLIYDSHELELDPLIREAQNIQSIKKQMLTSMLNELDYVITVSASIKNWFQNLHPRLPIEVIYNSPPLADEYNPHKLHKSELTLAFEGKINKKQGNLGKLITILEKCNQYFPLKVKIIGGGKHLETDYLDQLNPHMKDKMMYTGWVNYEKLPETMWDVDIGWIDLDAANSLNNRFAMPNKFFSYLNNGVPIIVNKCTDMENFINAYNCGYIVKKKQATAEDYVQSLVQLISDKNKLRQMGQNGRNMMETVYSWEHMEKRLYNVYERLLHNVS